MQVTMAMAETVDRQTTPQGEVALRRDGDHYEIISNGCFLMDTRDGTSERLLIRATVNALAAAGRTTDLSVLIGGLGVGFSLGEAVGLSTLSRIAVVEREAPVIAWGRTHLAPFSGHALDDPRVTVRHDDLVVWAHSEPQEHFDALCLDIDNGPDWTVTDGNARLYDKAGLLALKKHLTPGGVLAVWSATASPAFAERLRTVFSHVEVHPVPVRVPRGEPDVVFLAR
jgi:spermidine synthase